MHGLATALNPEWLKESLGARHIGAPPAGSFTHALALQNLGVRYEIFAQLFNAVPEFLSILGQIRSDLDEAVNPHYLQLLLAMTGRANFDGRAQQDAAEWLREMLNCLAEGHRYVDQLEGPQLEDARHKLVDSLFRADTAASCLCLNSECGAEWWSSDENDWTLNLRNDQNTMTTTIGDLLQARGEVQDVPDFQCDICGQRGIKKWFRGIWQFPENLIIRFDRTRVMGERDGRLITRKLRYTVELEEELDFEELDVSKVGRFIYSLSTIVKHYGKRIKSGHYVSYTQTRDGTWWRCDDQRVIKSSFRKALEDPGDVYLAFYQRLGRVEVDEDAAIEKRIQALETKPPPSWWDRFERWVWNDG